MTDDPEKLKVLPMLTNEELDELLIAVGMRLTTLQEHLGTARSPEVRGELKRRWNIENSIRTAVAEARHNGNAPLPGDAAEWSRRTPGPAVADPPMLDESDETGMVWVDSIAEPQLGIQVGGGVLANVHPESRCAGRPCVIHNPSDHHMREWTMNWRGDRRLMERLCPHGIGHPDPDDVAWHVSQGREYMGVHGCDGCCRPSTA